MLGLGGHALYVAPELLGPWRAVPGWGKEPAPELQQVPGGGEAKPPPPQQKRRIRFFSTWVTLQIHYLAPDSLEKVANLAVRKTLRKTFRKWRASENVPQALHSNSVSSQFCHGRIDVPQAANITSATLAEIRRRMATAEDAPGPDGGAPEPARKTDHDGNPSEFLTIGQRIFRL